MIKPYRIFMCGWAFLFPLVFVVSFSACREETEAPSKPETPLADRDHESPRVDDDQGRPSAARSTTTTPASQPGKLPAATQTATPVTTSRETASIAVEPFEPLRNAKPGEWAEYRDETNRRLRYEITEIEASLARTRVTVHADNQIAGEPAMRRDPLDYDPVARQAKRSKAVRTASRETIMLAGREWQAVCFKDEWMDEDIRYVRQTWVSDDAPVFGLLRMELRGDSQLEASLDLLACSDVSNELP